MSGTDSPTRGLRLALPWGVVLAVSAAATGPSYADEPAPTQACAWKVVSAPSPGIGSVVLRGLDALGPRNVWAVGSKNAQGATLVEHWNGTKWSVVTSPNKSGFTQLEDVTAISSDNVWAVGFYVPSGGSHPKTLIEHWNGTKWSVVASPNPIAGSNLLFGVDAVSAKNIWAVGGDNLDPNVGSKQITLQWNGSAWRERSGLSIESGLQDVAAIEATNVVAVGHTGTVGSSTPLIQRYNGSGWNSVAPGTSSTGAHLQAVSAKGPSGQWAVGQRSGNAALQTLTLRNTGSGWQEVPGANSSSTLINILHGVTALSGNEAWAVGYHENDSFVHRTMVQHFANGAWSIVPAQTQPRRAPTCSTSRPRAVTCGRSATSPTAAASTRSSRAAAADNIWVSSVHRAGRVSFDCHVQAQAVIN